MISTNELNSLIAAARAKGAAIEVQNDFEAMLEGRLVVDAVRVSGAKGIGPEWMPAIAAAERLREFCAN